MERLNWNTSANRELVSRLHVPVHFGLIRLDFLQGFGVNPGLLQMLHISNPVCACSSTHEQFRQSDGKAYPGHHDEDHLILVDQAK